MNQTVLEGRAHTHSACIFFAVAGAAILRKHYNLDAVPVSGAALYAVGIDDAVVARFGKVENGDLKATSDSFHCWVECKGYAIDFMAPIFEENLASNGRTTKVPRRVFQKPLAAMSPEIMREFRAGEFYLVPSQERTADMHRAFGVAPASMDLANICLYWYRRPPKRIDETLDMRNDLGQIARLTLHGPDVVGCW